MLITVKRISFEDCYQSENSAKTYLPGDTRSDSNVSEPTGTSTASIGPFLPKGSRPCLKPVPIVKDDGQWNEERRVEDESSIAHYERLDRQFQDYFVGPVPKDFYREFLPETASPMPRFRPSLVGALAQFNPTGEEQLLCRTLVSVVDIFVYDVC